MLNQKVGFFCKSFRPDFDHLHVLLDSFARHNPEHLPLVISLPVGDVQLFRDRFGNKPQFVSVIEDESYCETDLSRLRGWHGQQVCKLSADRAIELDHFVVLDSDCYLITDVSAADVIPREGRRFTACGSLIRTVVAPGNDRLIDYIRGSFSPQPEVFPPPDRTPSKSNILDFVDWKDLNPDDPDAIARSDIPFKVFGAKRWFYYQPGQIISSVLLREFRAFLAEYNLTIADVIRISPWEYNWYGEFASAMFANQTDFRVSPFIHFPDEQSLVVAKSKSLALSSIEKRFKFIQMAARHLAVLQYSMEPK